MNPKEVMRPVMRGHDPEGHPKVANGLLAFALGGVYISQDTVRWTHLKFLTFAERRFIPRE